MSVRNAAARRRHVQPEEDPNEAYVREGVSVILELVRLSNKLTERTSGRGELETRINSLVRRNVNVFGNRTTYALGEGAREAIQHCGWVLDFESLGYVSSTELAEGLWCHVEHPQEVLQLCMLHRPFSHSSGSLLNFGPRLVAGVVLARFQHFDPYFEIVRPALNSYSEMRRGTWNEMIKDLTRLLSPLALA